MIVKDPAFKFTEGSRIKVSWSYWKFQSFVNWNHGLSLMKVSICYDLTETCISHIQTKNSECTTF